MGEGRVGGERVGGEHPGAAIQSGMGRSAGFSLCLVVSRFNCLRLIMKLY